MCWEFILAVLALTILLYKYVTKDYGSYTERGYAEEPAYFPLGSITTWRLFTGRVGGADVTDDVYKKYPSDRFVIIWNMGKPQFIIRDVDLAKAILVKDFDHFVDREGFDKLDEESNKLFVNMLFVMKGDKWRAMRSLLSPIFTSGKLRHMTKYIQKVGDDMISHLDRYSRTREPFDAKSMMTSFTLDGISTVAFGINANSFKDPDNKFRQLVDVLTGKGTSLKLAVKMLTIVFLPSLANLLKLSLFDPATSKFFTDIIRRTMADRKASGERRNDLVDLMLDAMTKENQEEDAEPEDQFEKDALLKSGNKKIKVSDADLELLMTSNAGMFLFAGFETSSTTMSAALYFMAKHQRYQDELVKEIDAAIAENDGDEHLDYGTIMGMKYLDAVVHESIRMYPLVPPQRNCVKDYTIPGTTCVIKAGQSVFISPYIMRDAAFYDNPDKFDPDHFSAEAKASRTPYAFLGFGHGPRNCIGMRFALLNVKIALIRLLRNYRVITNEKTAEELKPEAKMVHPQPKGGVWVSIEQRKSRNE